MNEKMWQVLDLLKLETEIEIDQLYKRIDGLKASDLDQLSNLMLIRTTGTWQDNDAKDMAPLFIRITNAGRNAEPDTNVQRIRALEAENAALVKERDALKALLMPIVVSVWVTPDKRITLFVRDEPNAIICIHTRSEQSLSSAALTAIIDKIADTK